LIRDIPGMANYIDDIPLAAESFPLFVQSLTEFFTRCRAAHVRLHPRKSIIAPSVLPFLGHLISISGISIDPARLQPLIDARPPTDRQALLKFLGLLTWVRPHLHAPQELVAPFQSLLKKGSPFAWTSEHQHAFEHIKLLARTPFHLAFVRPGHQLVLRTDASSVGIGGALFQRDHHGH